MPSAPVPRPRTPLRAGRAAFATLLALGLPSAAALAGDTTTSLSASPGSPRYSAPVTFTATVEGAAPTGTVTFKDGAKTLGTARLAGESYTEGVIDGGDNHTCARTAAGGIDCWGSNQYGQLGDGSTTDSTTAVHVDGLSGRVAAVAVGGYHTCALTDAGGVKCWGKNNYGQLGNGTTTDSATPVDVDGLSSGVVALSGGSYHTCVITEAGAAKCWGYNSTGQLGDGSTTNSITPVDVDGLSSGVAAIAAGYTHSCAVTKTGTAKCWGNNSFGKLGDGTTTDSPTPVDVDGLSSGTVAVAAGQYHTCAFTEAGAAKCWGYNAYGQLGDGTATDSPTPVGVDSLSSGVAAIAAGNYHTCALTDAGAVKCWGRNPHGPLGDGTTTDSTTPVDASGFADGVAVAAGRYHTCAITDADAIMCWGQNSFGQLGIGTTASPQLLPVAAATDVAVSTDSPTAEATFTTKTLSAGTHKIKAVYSGDDANAASTSDRLSLKVRRGQTKIGQFAVTPRTPMAGETARVRVKVEALAPSTGKPRGRMVVREGKTTLGRYKVTKGTARFKLAGMSKGRHKLKFIYQRSGNWKRTRRDATVRVTE